jgi:hypothetical protein
MDLVNDEQGHKQRGKDCGQKGKKEEQSKLEAGTDS